MRMYRHIETGSVVCITDDRHMPEEYEPVDAAHMLGESSQVQGGAKSTEAPAVKPRATRKRATRKKVE